jgi:hypothetical protein
MGCSLAWIPRMSSISMQILWKRQLGGLVHPVRYLKRWLEW